jgi:hypothetical protein
MAYSVALFRISAFARQDNRCVIETKCVLNYSLQITLITHSQRRLLVRNGWNNELTFAGRNYRHRRLDALHSIKASNRDIIARLCGLVVRVTHPEVRVRFPALPDFLGNSGSGTGSTQPLEHN